MGRNTNKRLEIRQLVIDYVTLQRIPRTTRKLDLFLPFGAVRAGRGQLFGESYI